MKHTPHQQQQVETRSESVSSKVQAKMTKSIDSKCNNMRKSITQLAILLVAATYLMAKIETTQASYLATQQQQQISSSLMVQQQQPVEAPLAPTITPFAFTQNVQENQRASVLCTISSGEVPVTFSWLKDGQLLSPSIAQAKKIIIKPDSDQSTLKFASVRLDHAGNYTCVAKNRIGIQTHSAQLVVHGEPRWLREPQYEPIVATRGQTIIIDCQTTGWPKPQQSWQIKTPTQSEFESLAATGRISLAANGSLVIRNADKQDEANYQCKSANGIGKGLSWSTSLKVNVPAHFESTKQQTNIVRKQNQVQLRCDAHGDEPITIEWFKNKQRLTNELDPRYTIHNNPLRNGLISVLIIKQTQRSDNSIYECITRNQVGKDRLPIDLMVQEEPDNIQELQATQINSRSVTLMWTEPYDGRSPITNYIFQYKKVQEASPSLSEMDFMDQIDLSGQGSQASLNKLQQTLSQQTTADDWQQASRIVLPIQANNSSSSSSNGVKSITIERLDPSSKYVLRALAINTIGQSRFSQPMEFTTEEEAPEMGPTNIRAVAMNSTSVQVSWDEIPKSKQLGRIHGYYIGYRVANSTAQHNFVYKPYIINDLVALQQQQQQQQQQQSDQPIISGTMQRLDTIINDLRRDTAYEITVVAFNSRGSGPSSDFVLCKTNEMDAPKQVKLQIRRESNESIFIEWQRDPSDQNPVDDYVLYQEKNSAAQEWLHVRLPGNQTQYKAPGLKCGTRYQFYIIAHNKVGKSHPSEVVSASTSGALPVIPTKMSLIKMVNSTCLLVNLNSFQDNVCRIKTFTVRYRVEKSGVVMPNHGLPTLISSNGLAAQHQALQGTLINSKTGSVINGQQSTLAASASSSASTGIGSTPSEWITIRPKSNANYQRANEEDRMEYLCDLNPIGEYTIHVAAANDVGRSEIDYSVLMSSDELRHSALKEVLELISSLPNVFAYIPSILVFLLAGLLLSLLGIILYTTIIKYYQKFIIMHNQIRATRRAKQDERRRRKLNNSRHSQKPEEWVNEFVEAEEADGDDEEDDDSSASSSGGSNNNNHLIPHHQFANHYLSNIANSAFDTSSIDSPCNNNKFSNGSCMSTASTDSMNGRFHCLNSKQYVKMNEYTQLPAISATLNPPNEIYGTTANSNNGSLYYSTLRRSSMQTYLPHQRQQQHQHNHLQQQQHRRQNINDIYGYYMGPPANTSQAQQAAEEAANTIFVPPHQIIYSAPNIRRQPPVFL